jgi:hypothetical protein
VGSLVAAIVFATAAEEYVVCAETVDSGAAVDRAFFALSKPPFELCRTEFGALTTRGSDFGLGSTFLGAGSFDGGEVSSLSALSVVSDADEVEPAESDLVADGDFVIEEGEFVEESLVDVDDEEFESDGDDVESSANATAGQPASTTPTPSATASPPTRPMYLALPVVCAR